MDTNVGSSSFRLDVLTAPNDGLNPSLLLTLKKVIQSQYLFNVPEGFARFALEHKLRPGLGLRAVFLTGVGHECHGLPGLVMRLRGDGHGAFELFGPSPSLEYTETLPNVCSWSNPAILVNTNIRQDVYEDENVIIRAIIDGQDVVSGVHALQDSEHDRATILEQLGNLCPPLHKERHSIFGRTYQKEKSIRHGNVWVRHPESQFSNRSNNSISNVVLGYICRVKGSGETIVISGYSQNHFIQAASITQHPLVSSSIQKKEAPILIMCSSFDTSRDDDHTYATLLDSNTCIRLNIVGKAAEGDSNLGFDSTAKMASKLHGICPYLFPLPHCWKYLKETNTSFKSTAHQDGVLPRGLCGPFTYAFQLHSSGKGLKLIPYISDASVTSREGLEENRQKIQALKDIEILKHLQDQVHQKMVQQANTSGAPLISNTSAAAALRQRLLSSRKRKCDQLPKSSIQDEGIVFADSLHDPYILFLGTGSAEPSKYRGPSGIFIKVPFCEREEYILLECGEGTFGQLVRMFGYPGAMERIAKTRCVWISHRHADHMSGLIELLCRRSTCKASGGILVLGPNACIRWVSSLSRILDIGDVQLEHILAIPSSSACQNLQESICASMHCTPVHHCHDSYAISICFSERFKLVYSGDTEQCQALIDIGQGADLLIHEATFEPDMVQDARRKKHSTVAEAIVTAKKMNATRTILTHFSQRYPKFPKGIPDHRTDSNADSLSVAFDGYCLRWTLLDESHKFMPYFRALLEGNP